MAFQLEAGGGGSGRPREPSLIRVCVFLASAQVPAALLTLAWDAGVQADIAAAGGKSPSLLKPELLEKLQTLS